MERVLLVGFVVSHWVSMGFYYPHRVAEDPLTKRWWWPFDSPGHGTSTGSVIISGDADLVTGTEFRLGDFAGRVVCINFWAYW